jgi:hypothetical protein
MVCRGPSLRTDGNSLRNPDALVFHFRSAIRRSVRLHNLRKDIEILHA